MGAPGGAWGGWPGARRKRGLRKAVRGKGENQTRGPGDKGGPRGLGRACGIRNRSRCPPPAPTYPQEEAVSTKQMCAPLSGTLESKGDLVIHPEAQGAPRVPGKWGEMPCLREVTCPPRVDGHEQGKWYTAGSNPGPPWTGCQCCHRHVLTGGPKPEPPGTLGAEAGQAMSGQVGLYSNIS